MKRRIKAILSGLVIVAMTVSMLAYLTRLVERKDGYKKRHIFYEQAEDFDVLFFGSSRVDCGILPMELWENYGMAAYNCSFYGSFPSTTYWTVKNDLKYSSPKLAVIDCYWLDCVAKGASNNGQLRVFFDTLPLGKNKLQAVMDLTRQELTEEELENMSIVQDDKVDYIWNFGIYHDRWNELTKDDFSTAACPAKGPSQYPAGIVSADAVPAIDDSLRMENDTISVRYLRQMIEYCQDQGIQVLLTYLPFPANEGYQRVANRAAVIAEEYGVGYVDLLKADGLVNFHIDLNDIYYHLNASGAQKVTDYLGQYIMDHYDIPDRRNDPAYADWYGDYKAYTQFKIDTIAGQTGLKNYLMLLYDKHLSSCVYLAPNDLWQEDEIYLELLENIGIDPEMLPEEPVLAVVDHMEGEVTYLTAGQTVDTGFREVAFDLKDGTYSIQVGGAEAMAVDPDAVAGAVVIDDTAGTVAASSQFSMTAASVNKIN